MKLIGITGPTGAGKTTALRALEELGAVLLDADAIYHTLLAENSGLRSELTARFGDILNGTGSIDRKKLGGVVFGNPAALDDLNRITHKFVGLEIDRAIAAAQAECRPAVAIDAIALIESGLGERCDCIVAVLAPVEVRVRRIMAREGISEDYARKRVAAQREDAFFRAHCTYVLENGAEDTPEQFGARARELLVQLI